MAIRGEFTRIKRRPPAERRSCTGRRRGRGIPAAGSYRLERQQLLRDDRLVFGCGHAHGDKIILVVDESFACEADAAGRAHVRELADAEGALRVSVVALAAPELGKSLIDSTLGVEPVARVVASPGY